MMSSPSKSPLIPPEDLHWVAPLMSWFSDTSSSGASMAESRVELEGDSGANCEAGEEMERENENDWETIRGDDNSTHYHEDDGTSSEADKEENDNDWETIRSDFHPEYDFDAALATDTESLYSLETITKDNLSVIHTPTPARRPNSFLTLTSSYFADDESTPRPSLTISQSETRDDILELLGLGSPTSTDHDFTPTTTSHEFTIRMLHIKANKIFRVRVREDMRIVELARVVEAREGVPMEEINLVWKKVRRLFDGDEEGWMGERTLGMVSVAPKESSGMSCC